MTPLSDDARYALALVLVGIRGHWDRVYGEQVRAELAAKMSLDEEFEGERAGLVAAAQLVMNQLYTMTWTRDLVRKDLDGFQDRDGIRAAALAEHAAIRHGDHQFWRAYPDSPHARDPRFWV